MRPRCHVRTPQPVWTMHRHCQGHKATVFSCSAADIKPSVSHGAFAGIQPFLKRLIDHLSEFYNARLNTLPVPFKEMASPQTEGCPKETWDSSVIRTLYHVPKPGYGSQESCGESMSQHTPSAVLCPSTSPPPQACFTDLNSFIQEISALYRTQGGLYNHFISTRKFISLKCSVPESREENACHITIVRTSLFPKQQFGHWVRSLTIGSPRQEIQACTERSILQLQTHWSLHLQASYARSPQDG